MSSTVSLGATLPAVADQSVTSNATVTLVAGELSITAPSNTVNLGSSPT